MSEDLDEQPRALRPKPLDLDVMSIGELSEYIGELESEIERVRSADCPEGRAKTGGGCRIQTLVDDTCPVLSLTNL